jgi:hypothetical protein
MCLGAVKPVRTDLQYRARNKLRSERRERRNAVPLWLPVRMPTGQEHAGSSVLTSYSALLALGSLEFKLGLSRANNKLEYSNSPVRLSYSSV